MKPVTLFCFAGGDGIDGFGISGGIARHRSSGKARWKTWECA